MAGNSFDVGERKTHEIDNSKPSEFNDAFEGFSKTKRESFTDRVKPNSGVRLDTPTSTPQQKQAAPELETQETQSTAASVENFSETAEAEHRDWFEWVKQFRSVDTQPVTRINGRSVVPSVKKVIARFARLGAFEQRIMLDALELMTRDEHITVVNSYYDSFATDTNEGGYSHTDNEDVQQYAQQLAESQQREHELQNKVDELQAELAAVRDRIEHEDARAQVDAGLKGTAADPHRDDDSAPVIDGAADKEDAEEEPTIDQPDKQAPQGADETASGETADDSTAGSDDDEPVIDNPSGADDEPDDDEDNDTEDSDVEGFDDFASEMEENANPEEDAAIAAQAAQDQQKAEAEAAAELEQQRQVEAQEQAEGE